jgi:hypothetical protein
MVATMRAIEDQAAVLFTRELYRSFVEGFSLEPAVVEARLALSGEKWNWSSYALFAGTRLGLDIPQLSGDLSY